MKRKRRTFTHSQIRNYVNTYQEFSGTKQEFCDIHNLSVHTLANWQRDTKKSFDSSFLEIDIPVEQRLNPIIKFGDFSLSNFDTIPQAKLTQILQSFVEVHRVSTSTN
jgi:hypothetical protein